MAKKKAAKKKASSWHNIKQASSSRAATKISRKRKLNLSLRTMGTIAAIVLVLLGVAFGIHYLNTRPGTLKVAGVSEPLRQVYFETDGVLTREWLMERLDLPAQIELASIDIAGIRQQLMGEGQTREVTVEKRYPDTLVVSVEEREPLLHLVIVDAAGRKGLRLVDASGFVYHGAHYDKASLAKLPFLVVDRVERDGNGFAPIEGMSTVSELVLLARDGHPDRYANWKIVSLQDYDPQEENLGATIRVTTRDNRELVFAPTQFGDQMERLEHILVDPRINNLRDVERIDLSFHEPVIKMAKSGARLPSRY